MAKYYTPSIAEFHIGFEFEYCPLFKDEWIKKVLEPTKRGLSKLVETYEDYPDDSLADEMYRVKYLDKTDIEELGFEESFDEPGEWFWKYKDNMDIQLYFDDKHGNKDQGIGVTIYNDTIVFSGYIKNKSELKVLLKQLEING